MTSSQFDLLMTAIKGLGERLERVEDKIDGRLTPLEQDLQRRIGATGARRELAGISRSTVAVIAGTVGIAAFVADRLLG